MKTGSYIKSRRETVRFSRCAKITLYKPAGGLLTIEKWKEDKIK